MRKRLGSLEKAPIEKMEQSATKNTFAFISCILALALTHFGINFGVDFFNFLEENMDGNDFLTYNEQIVWYIKGAVGLLAVVFILNRQS